MPARGRWPCSRAVSLGVSGAHESGVDMRDCSEQGMPYNGSGCLIHGMANVADSFTAMEFVEKK